MSQTAEAPPKVPFYLRDNFAPIKDEFTETHLEVIGNIPEELSGRYFRNGPNPHAEDFGHWFLGDGMIHGVELSEGRANWYKNRYVETPYYLETESARAEGLFNLANSRANTHVLAHAGKILALEELHHPFELTRDLETVGPYDYAGKLTTGMTAHPKICPKTGEMLFFAYGVLPPFLTYHRVSKDGTLVQSEVIEIPAATMVHDFNITENYVIFMDLPMLFDVNNVGKGGIPLKFDASYGARLGVLPRNGGNADVKWFDIEPCYVFHPANSYEDGDVIHVDVCRSGHDKEKGELDDPAYFHRWSIDLKGGSVKETPLDDRFVEFPRVPDALAGQPYRYTYMAGFDGAIGHGAHYIHKYDLANGNKKTLTLPGAGMTGEPVFVPRAGGSSEDDGWLMTFFYSPETNKSEFVILDAATLDAEPVARVKLPTRVPHGFHGSWIDDSVL